LFYSGRWQATAEKATEGNQKLKRLFSPLSFSFSEKNLNTRAIGIQ
jgi:hypothetical protein